MSALRLALIVVLLLALTVTSAVAQTLPPKLAWGIYYPWYPYAGMFYVSAGKTLPPRNVNGYAGQDAFPYTFTTPIPYLWSKERPQGNYDYAAAVAWHKTNLQHFTGIGLDAILIMGRPDLPSWYEMLSALLEAHAQVPGAPKLAFYFDGVEYWETHSPTSGGLSGPGADFDAIWRGIEITYDIALAHPDALMWLGNKIPVWFYRIEANAGPFTGSGWWVDQLKANITARYHRDAYVVLDNYWHTGPTYGNGITLHTDNADNYSFWGGALYGVLVSAYAGDLKIASLGPGFDNRKVGGGSVKDRQAGLWYTSQWQVIDANPAIRWVTIETLNFGEEGSAIDQTVEWGALYLNITRTQIAAWKQI